MHISKFQPEPEPLVPQQALSIRSLSEDRAFSKIFSTYKICTEEKHENAKNTPTINAFKHFDQGKMYKQLYMPAKKSNEELFCIEQSTHSAKKSNQLVPKSIGQNTYEIAKKVENKQLQQIIIQKQPHIGQLKF